MSVSGTCLSLLVALFMDTHQMWIFAGCVRDTHTTFPHPERHRKFMALSWLKHLESGTGDDRLSEQRNQAGIHQCLFVLRVEREMMGPEVGGRGSSVERVPPGNRKPRFQTYTCHSFALWPLTCHFSPLGHSFVICQIMELNWVTSEVPERADTLCRRLREDAQPLSLTAFFPPNIVRPSTCVAESYTSCNWEQACGGEQPRLPPPALWGPCSLT